MKRTRTRAMIVAITLATGALGVTAAGTPAHAAVTGPIDCPTALPTAQAVEGLTGTGYTVERGTQPDPFSATVIGRLTDGIAPGVDMIMAEINSPAVERAGGIWAGISGSPVYSTDGKLIGSVSYGLASAGNIAGLTPGADLNKVYSAAATGTAKSRIPVGTAAAKKIAAASDVSVAQARGGFTPLPIPITASGVSHARNSKPLARLGKKLGGVAVVAGGDVASAKRADTDTIFAGSNFAAALSYGDVTFAGVGTTTTVCDGTAVAFGHPFSLYNKTSLSAHSASAVYVQRDDVYGAFKAANIGGIVGTVDRDLTNGIRAKLGVTPTTYPVTTSISEDGDAPVNGRSVGVLQQIAPDLAAVHVQSQIDRQGGYWEGSAALTYQVTGTRKGGQPFSVTLKDHVADRYWMSLFAADPVYGMVSRLQTQPYEPVKITGVDVTGTVSQTFKQYRVNNVRQWKGGAWSSSRSIVTKAGGTIKLRVSISPFQSESVKYLYYTLAVPKKTSGATGSLTVTAGDRGPVAAAATKFDTVLKQLATPAGDSVVASLNLAPDAKPVTVRRSADAAVDYYGKDYSVTVK